MAGACESAMAAYSRLTYCILQYINHDAALVMNNS